MDIVRHYRLIEYVGPRDLVEKQIANSLHGSRKGASSKDGEVVITAVSIAEFPHIMGLAACLPIDGTGGE